MTTSTTGGLYNIIYADPPWHYKQGSMFMGTKETSSAITHYPTMSKQQLEEMDVPSLAADDCLLFMWSSSPHIDEAIDLITAWGFHYKTVAVVWDKVKTNPGFYTMSQVELCLVGKKGKIPQPRGVRNAKQMLTETRTRHSAKPAEIRQRIELMFPTQPKLELFARQQTAGWDVFGNDNAVIENTISL